MSYPARRNPDGTWTPYGRRLVVLLVLLVLANQVAWSYIARAVAAEPTPDIVAQSGVTECWTKDRTFVHVILRNQGTAGGRYYVTVERNDRTDTWSRRVGPGKALQDGYLVRPGETIPRVIVMAQGVTQYLRVDVTSLSRCER